MAVILEFILGINIDELRIYRVQLKCIRVYSDSLSDCSNNMDLFIVATSISITLFVFFKRRKISTVGSLYLLWQELGGWEGVRRIT